MIRFFGLTPATDPAPPKKSHHRAGVPGITDMSHQKRGKFCQERIAFSPCHDQCGKFRRPAPLTHHFAVAGVQINPALGHSAVTVEGLLQFPINRWGGHPKFRERNISDNQIWIILRFRWMTRCLFHSKGHMHIAHQTVSILLQNHKFTKEIAEKKKLPHTKRFRVKKHPYIWNKVHHA